MVRSLWLSHLALSSPRPFWQTEQMPNLKAKILPGQGWVERTWLGDSLWPRSIHRCQRPCGWVVWTWRGPALHSSRLTDSNLFSQPSSTSQCVMKKSNSTHWEINSYPQTSYSRSGYKPFTTLLAFSPNVFFCSNSWFTFLTSLKSHLITISRIIPHSPSSLPLPWCTSSLYEPWRPKYISQLNKYSLFRDFRIQEL